MRKTKPPSQREGGVAQNNTSIAEDNGGIADINPGDDEINTGDADINQGVAEINTRVDVDPLKIVFKKEQDRKKEREEIDLSRFFKSVSRRSTEVPPPSRWCG